MQRLGRGALRTLPSAGQDGDPRQPEDVRSVRGKGQDDVRRVRRDGALVAVEPHLEARGGRRMGPARRADVSAAPRPEAEAEAEAEEERRRRKRKRRRGDGAADAAARRERGPPPGRRRAVASALRECLVGGDEEAELVLVKPAVEPVPFESRRWQLHEAFSFPTAVAAEDPASDAGVYWEPVVHAFLATERLSSALNGPLTAAALEEEATTASLSVSNRGGSFHSGTRFLRPARGGDASRGPRARLRRAVLEAVASADRYEDEGMSDDDEDEDEGDGSKCEITSSWANVSREGGYHGLYNHENASWSGVYYPSVPPADPSTSGRDPIDPLAGAIVFRLASGERGRCSFSYVRPRPGLLLVFPPWLLHCVMPAAAGGRPRVSIAFNTDER